MSQWKKTTCVLCANTCGLEVAVENNRLTKVRPDKDHPISQGYVCRKGLNIIHHHHHADRLDYPLKKVSGSFQRISWEQAIDEIAERLGSTVKTHGPRSLAYMGGGGVGWAFEGFFGRTLLRGLGSQYMYNALAQELTGKFWADGRCFGRQYLHAEPDLDETDMLLVIGWNPMMSHHTPRARRVMTQIAKDPAKLLVVVDPRRSETARLADIHLPIRPGTDALLHRAMISIILNEGWHSREYMDHHVGGFEKIRSWFTDFDARKAIDVCELDYDTVREVCRAFAGRKSSLRCDLGVLMTRHSTLISYLEDVLLAICGRVGVRGGNVFPGNILGRGGHSDERNPKTWRTLATDFPAICGVYPPNAMPEEILSDGLERLRAVIVSSTNPLRSFADTTAYEKAFQRLDLLVSIELAMTETAALAHYVLPARSSFESWDGTLRSDFPRVFFQMRRPVVEPEAERIEAGEVFTRLADRLGLVPHIPQDLHAAAESKDRTRFAAALIQYLQTNPKASSRISLILSKTLGKALGSGNLACLWGLLQNLPASSHENAAREGFTPGPGLGEQLFQAILDHPEGTFVGRLDTEKNLTALETEDGRINLNVPEMADWIEEVTPDAERRRIAPDVDYPLILSAGRHMDMNANTLMRNPQWNEEKRACTLAMHPEDARRLELIDGQTVRVTTEAGQEVVEVELTEEGRPGHVVLPQGFGLVYQGRVYGANVNRLTSSTHRDRLAGTPLHRYVKCSVEAL